MRTLAQLQLKAFTRRWPLMFMAALAVITAVALGVYEVYLALRADAVLTDILANFTRYSVLWPLVVTVVTYEFASRARLAHMEESIASHASTVHQHWLALMVPPALLLSLIFGIRLVFRLVVIAVAHRWRLMLPGVFAEAVLDVLVPCAIGLLLGLVASVRLGRYAGYAVIALFAFLIGPYAEVVPFIAQMGMLQGGGGINLYPIYDMFRILAPDPTWGMDPLYGFPVEQSRWMLAGVWLLGLLAAALPRLTTPRRRGIRYAQTSLAVLAVLCLVTVMMPSSELRRDWRVSGAASVAADQAYYEMQIAKHPQREFPADFTVRRYAMDLSAGRQLNATVTMDITDDEHSDAYRFTLYHGYDVSRVLDQDGRRLAFVQEGDYITVTSAGKQRQVTFEYSGGGGAHIANYQCVYLPGYFPYYPVPGFGSTWDFVHQTTRMSVAERTPSEFSVMFHSTVPLASDLEENAGRFEGRAVAPSFVGGMLAQEAVAGHRVIYYPAGAEDPQQLAAAVAAAHETELRLGVAERIMPTDTTVFQLPSLEQYSMAAVDSGGPLFVLGFSPVWAADIVMARTPPRIDRENLKEALVRYLNDTSGLDSADSEQPTRLEISNLEEARRSAANDLECVQAYVLPARSVVQRLLLDKIQSEGEDAALRDTYRYLASDSPMSELEFLSQASDGEPR